MIESYSDILTNSEWETCLELVKRPRWEYGRASLPSTELITFWKMSLSDENFFTDTVKNRIDEVTGKIHQLDKVVANGQTFGQAGQYHPDNEVHSSGQVGLSARTFLIYCNEDYLPDMGGHTYFWNKRDKEITVITPWPNSGVYFSGDELHKGMPFNRQTHPLRISIAFTLFC